MAPQLDNPLLCLASLMDHTPGQRQWRELASHKRFTMGTTGMSEAEYDAHVTKRIAEGGANAERNRPIMLDMFRGRGIPLATHDDTTEEHVKSGAALGIAISEFPTTLVAATTAKALGLATIAGAPNVVCGGSQSGGVSVAELAERGVLDGFSSDYAGEPVAGRAEALPTAPHRLSHGHGHGDLADCRHAWSRRSWPALARTACRHCPVPLACCHARRARPLVRRAARPVAP